MHWPMRVEGAETGDRVQTAMHTMEKALLEMTSVHQLSFILENRKYIGLGSLGTNPNFAISGTLPL